jgi:hypothetical protein
MLCHAVAIVTVLLHVVLLCVCVRKAEMHATIDLQFYATSCLHDRSVMFHFFKHCSIQGKLLSHVRRRRKTEH